MGREEDAQGRGCEAGEARLGPAWRRLRLWRPQARRADWAPLSPLSTQLCRRCFCNGKRKRKLGMTPEFGLSGQVDEDIVRKSGFGDITEFSSRFHDL